MKTYEIAVVHGDGIGPEVCQSAVDVLTAAFGASSPLIFKEYPAGAGTYLKTGNAVPPETFDGCKKADAILHGAAGLPEVTFADGTGPGNDFGLKLRFDLDLYANIRPIKLRPGVNSRLRDRKAGEIDYVILRENTEGLYAARGHGNLLRDEVATDTMIVTRKGIERICHAAFKLARGRNGAPRDGKKRVTLCDKSNILRSYAFFNRIFNEVADAYPDIERDFGLADAMTVYLLERPDFYDVIVMENMLGDIMSDLGAATVGGMGMSPSSELGDTRGFFQAAHGSAPTIAGKGIANPYGTILSAGAMLSWLADRHDDQTLRDTALRIERVVNETLASGAALTADIGGSARTQDVTRIISAAVKPA